MKAVRLGSSEVAVSKISFGTMLFGESASDKQAHNLLGMAAEHGVTLFDSAEMYPVPQRAATQGASERILGDWLSTQSRDKFAIATKVAGPSGQMLWLRGGPTALDGPNITEALDGSLRRLRTDYIDLYQLHWPDRYVPMFGDVDYDPSCAYTSVPLEEQLEALGRAVEAGKVRCVGVSNETPWGLMQACWLAKTHPHLPKVASIQNAYSLLCRTFDAGLAECCDMERVAMLAYSPLAMGLLTGKYLDPSGGPPEARLNKYKGRYAEAEARYGPRPNVVNAVQAYADLAAQHDITLAEMAVRFVIGHPLIASTIVGATSTSQLQQLLGAADRGALSDNLLLEIDQIHHRFPNPTP